MLIPDHETAVDFLKYDVITQTVVVELPNNNRKRPPTKQVFATASDHLHAIDDRIFWSICKRKFNCWKQSLQKPDNQIFSGFERTLALMDLTADWTHAAQPHL